MTTAALQPLSLEVKLPWETDEGQENKFKNMLRRVLAPLLLLFVVIPFLPVFELSYEPREPEVTTTVVLKPVEVTPFEPEPPKVQPKPQPVAKKEPDKAAASPKLQTKQKVKPKLEPKQRVEQSQGLNELSNQLAMLRGSLDIDRLQKKNVTSSKLGEAKVSNREFLGKDGAAKRSDGIEVTDEMLSGSSAGLGEYTSTSVDGSGLGEAFESSLAAHRSSKSGERDFESVRRTLEGAKSRIFAEYNVARRENPDLEGRVIFEIVIEPSGNISKLRLITSELGVAQLEQRIMDRVRSLNFGAEEVRTARIQYTFTFFPS